jgi:murein L,D-transpeptidase YcbB/YkuD
VKKVLSFIIFCLSACHNIQEHSAQSASPDPVQKRFTVNPDLLPNAPLHCREAVNKVYTSRNFSAVWLDHKGKTPVADSLLNVIRTSETLGLIPADYHIGELDMMADSVSEDLLGLMDLLLTDSYLTLRQHVKHGRLDRKTFSRRDLSAVVDADGILALQNISEAFVHREIKMLEPKVESYRDLKNALRDLLVSKETERDSVILQRLQALSVNMERWRWETNVPVRYVSVNIPAFLLRVTEEDSVLLESKVVVGKRDTPTPVMESVIRSFIIYPYWHVPRSIAMKEILPALQADSSYLRKNNFDVLNKEGKVVEYEATIPWKLYDAENFPFVLRQREGFENSMGIIKFVFANPYGVYLHDTNSKRLYARKRRDLSHGCVRVHQAVDLAHYLVRDDDIYVSPEDLDQYLSLQQRLKIDLRKPIPVKLQYFTCEFTKGTIRFYDDIYKKDSVMIQSLYHPSTTRLPL